MTVGERIKKIRIFRHMTMDELGVAVGFDSKSANVRISQYESGTRIPKTELLMKIADVLDCNYRALCDYNLGSAEDIIETLFWLEESTASNEDKSKHFPEYTGPNGFISLSNLVPANHSLKNSVIFDEDKNDFSGDPVAVIFNYGLVNDLLKDWVLKKNELEDEKITPREYFEWKIKYPIS